MELEGKTIEAKTAINNTAGFELPNLVIVPKEDQVVVTFTHESCISQYDFKICDTKQGTKFCSLGFYIPEAKEHNITFTRKKLDSCTKYYLHIDPIHNGHVIQSVKKLFTTSAPEATPPDEVNITLSADQHFIELKWSMVKCASGYKILQKIGEGNIPTKWESLNVNFSDNENPVPCTTYK